MKIFDYGHLLKRDLEKAISSGDVKQVESIIKSGISQRDKNFGLYLAFKKRNPKIAEMLYLDGAEVTHRDIIIHASDNLTQIINNFNLDTISKFFTSRSSDYPNALSTAFWSGREDVVSLLLSLGYRIEFQGNNRDVEIVESILENPEMLDILIENGFDVRSGDNILLRQSFGSPKMISKLISLGADIHSNNDETLVEAVKVGNIAATRLLLDLGADPNVIRYSDNDETINLLSELGIDIVGKYYDCSGYLIIPSYKGILSKPYNIAESTTNNFKKNKFCGLKDQTKIPPTKIMCISLDTYGLGDLVFGLKFVRYLLEISNNISIDLLTSVKGYNFLKDKFENRVNLIALHTVEYDQASRKLNLLECNQKFEDTDILFISPTTSQFVTGIPRLEFGKTWNRLKNHCYLISEFNLCLKDESIISGIENGYSSSKNVGITLTNPEISQISSEKEFENLMSLTKGEIYSIIYIYKITDRVYENFIIDLENYLDKVKKDVVDIFVSSVIYDEISKFPENKSINLIRLPQISYDYMLQLYIHSCPVVFISGDQSLADYLSVNLSEKSFGYVWYEIMEWKQNLAKAISNDRWNTYANKYIRFTPEELSVVTENIYNDFRFKGIQFVKGLIRYSKSEKCDKMDEDEYDFIIKSEKGRYDSLQKGVVDLDFSQDGVRFDQEQSDLMSLFTEYIPVTTKEGIQSFLTNFEYRMGESKEVSVEIENVDFGRCKSFDVKNCRYLQKKGEDGKCPFTVGIKDGMRYHLLPKEIYKIFVYSVINKFHIDNIPSVYYAGLLSVNETIIFTRRIKKFIYLQELVFQDVLEYLDILTQFINFKIFLQDKIKFRYNSSVFKVEILNKPIVINDLIVYPYLKRLILDDFENSSLEISKVRYISNESFCQDLGKDDLEIFISNINSPLSEISQINQKVISFNGDLKMISQYINYIK